MRIHYLQHVPYEPPALVSDWALDRGHTVEGTRLYDSEKLPRTSDFDWLVVMGGPMGVDDEDEHPWLVDEKELIDDALEADKAVLGICLGAQLVAESIGGEVYPHDETEIGWYPVRLTDEGTKTEPFSHLPDEFPAFHWHGDTFDLPDGVEPTASTDVCENQAFVYRNAVGLQFHLESTRRTAERLVEESEVPDGDYVQDPDEMLSRDFGVLEENAVKLLDGIENTVSR